MWTPGHAGIKGNHQADTAAKIATLEPLILHNTNNKKDINKLVNNYATEALNRIWNNYNHFYKTINPERQPTNIPTTTNRNDAIIFTRFRLTHTSLTHEHLMKKLPAPLCPYCNTTTLTTQHLLNHCDFIKNI